jgi:secondary thiamine-phosphate synthase enzyme
MLRQFFHELTIATRGRGLYEFTREVENWLAQNKFNDGLLTVHLQHTSASLLIQENADPDVRRDLEAFFKRLVPDGDALFIHTAEGDDDMPAHIRTALTTVNLGIPVRAGRPVLGTWQGIYLWEHRARGHARRVTLHFIGECKILPTT